MARPDVARRPPSLPWTVRVQLAELSLAHHPDGSVRRILDLLPRRPPCGRQPPPGRLGCPHRRRYRRRPALDVAQRWTSAMTTATAPSSSSLRLAGAILIQPFFGGEERTEAEVALDEASPALSMAVTDAYWREFLPEGSNRDHAAARVCGGERVELAEAFPPAMVAVGGFDLLKGWQARYVEALRGKGKPVRVVEYPGAIHGFHAFPEIADSGKLVEDIKLFVDEQLYEGVGNRPAFLQNVPVQGVLCYFDVSCCGD